MTPVSISEAAWSDIRDIAVYIAQSSPKRASALVDQLYDCCHDIGAYPRRYPLLPGREESGIRRRVFGNYLIFYRVGPVAIDIIHVLHGARDFDDILFADD